MLDIESRLIASVEIFYGVRGTACSNMPIVEAARKIVDAGFGVEILLADYWDVVKPPSEETINCLAEICRDAKLMTTHACLNAWSPDAFKEEVRLAARVGVSTMVVHPYVLGFGFDGFCPPDEDVKDLCKFALDNGMRLALENLGKTGINSMRHTLDVVGYDIQKSGLGVCIDVGHVNRSCKVDGIRPEAFLSEFKDIILEVHIDDNFGDDDLHLPPGYGNVDWPPVIDAMQNLRSDAVVCLEIAAPDHPLQTIFDARNFLLQRQSATIDCK